MWGDPNAVFISWMFTDQYASRFLYQRCVPVLNSDFFPSISLFCYIKKGKEPIYDIPYKALKYQSFFVALAAFPVGPIT